ncbi:MAG: hypothetical protein JXD21_07370 [Candidatus Omnitrophica bacterium]|nr:hypothetical protein [Candidatus Omnitrophota bacterium]
MRGEVRFWLILVLVAGLVGGGFSSPEILAAAATVEKVAGKITVIDTEKSTITVQPDAKDAQEIVFKLNRSTPIEKDGKKMDIAALMPDDQVSLEYSAGLFGRKKVSSLKAKTQKMVRPVTVRPQPVMPTSSAIPATPAKPPMPSTSSSMKPGTTPTSQPAVPKPPIQVPSKTMK